METALNKIINVMWRLSGPQKGREIASVRINTDGRCYFSVGCSEPYPTMTVKEFCVLIEEGDDSEEPSLSHDIDAESCG